MKFILYKKLSTNWKAIYCKCVHKLIKLFKLIFPPLCNNRWEEERAKYLENLSHELINNNFKNLTTNADALNLQVFVEDVYETRIGPNNANLSIVEMMKAIEIQYRDELLKLDKLPKDQVSVLEGNYYEEQMQIMRLAEKAAKEYVELERIIHSLNRALEPPYIKTGIGIFILDNYIQCMYSISIFFFIFKRIKATLASYKSTKAASDSSKKLNSGRN